MYAPETFLWGFLGSAAVELVSLLGFYSRGGRLPERYRRVGFWVTRSSLALLGGALAVGYGIDQRMLAFNVGAATPLIITFMAQGLRSGTSPTPPAAENSATPGRRTISTHADTHKHGASAGPI